MPSSSPSSSSNSSGSLGSSLRCRCASACELKSSQNNKPSSSCASAYGISSHAARRQIAVKCNRSISATFAITPFLLMLEHLSLVLDCAVIVAKSEHRRGSLLRVVYIGHACPTSGRRRKNSRTSKGASYKAVVPPYSHPFLTSSKAL